jgi:hypothetical protein
MANSKKGAGAKTAIYKKGKAGDLPSMSYGEKMHNPPKVKGAGPATYKGGHRFGRELPNRDVSKRHNP